MKQATVFSDSFYAPLLAGGSLPNEDKIPEQLLAAMAIMFSRSTGEYIDPMECRRVAALVALAVCDGLILSCPAGDELPKPTKERLCDVAEWF